MKDSLMKNMRFTLQLGLSATAIAILAACGHGGDGEGGSGGATMPITTGLLQSLTIAPTAASSVVACSAVQYVATGKYSDGTFVDVTNGVFWEVAVASSDVAIANSSNGLFVGIKPGNATIGAWTGSGIAASAVLNVSSGSLTGIAVTPAASTVAVAGTLSYTANATCSNGTLDISRMNIWASSSPSIATISTSGLATGVVAGSSVISATAGAVAASAVLNVQ